MPLRTTPRHVPLSVSSRDAPSAPGTLAQAKTDSKNIIIIRFFIARSFSGRLIVSARIDSSSLGEIPALRARE